MINLEILCPEDAQHERETEGGKLHGENWRRWRGLGYKTMREICQWAKLECPQREPLDTTPKGLRSIPGRRVDDEGQCEKCGAKTRWQTPVFDRWAYWCGC